MKCPHCNEEIQGVQTAYRNLESYRTPVNVTTECCGNIVRISISNLYNITIPFNHDELNRDDWGREKIKQK